VAAAVAEPSLVTAKRPMRFVASMSRTWRAAGSRRLPNVGFRA